MKIRLTLALTTLFASTLAQALTPLEQAVQSSFSGTFATAALLSDDDVIKFGVWDFNPNEYINTDNENLGSAESTELRQSLRQFNLPLRFRLSEYDPADRQPDRLSLIAKLAYLDVEREQRLVPSPESAEDEIYHQVASAGVGLGYLRSLDEHWDVTLKAYATWMRYHNEIDFNTTESRLLASFLDDLISNLDLDLMMLEPAAGIHYNWGSQATRYRLFTNVHYMKGNAINADIDAHKIKPEAWYWSNGFVLQKPLTEGWAGHSVWFRISRTDMGGALEGAFESMHYYEAGVAWLMDTPDSWRFIRNLGVGVNLNYGSDLRGGTLIFLYNFDEFE